MVPVGEQDSNSSQLGGDTESDLEHVVEADCESKSWVDVFGAHFNETTNVGAVDGPALSALSSGRCHNTVWRHESGATRCHNYSRQWQDTRPQPFLREAQAHSHLSHGDHHAAYADAHHGVSEPHADRSADRQRSTGTSSVSGIRPRVCETYRGRDQYRSCQQWQS